MPGLEMRVSRFSREGRSYIADVNQGEFTSEDASHLTLYGSVAVGESTIDANFTLFTMSGAPNPIVGNMTVHELGNLPTLVGQKKITRGLFNQFAADLATAKTASLSINHDGGPLILNFFEALPPDAVRNVLGIVLRVGDSNLG